MRRSTALALACLIVAALAAPVRGDVERLVLVRVAVDSIEEATYLTSRFDETHNHGPGHVELLLWPGDARRLAVQGFDFEVVSGDVVARDRAILDGPRPLQRLPGPDREDYRRLPDYEQEMRKLAKSSPLVRLIEFPHDSLEGRTVLGVAITAGNARDGRPTFYVDGIHHAREWPAAEYPMIFAHYLVERFGKDRRVTDLLRRLSVVVVPVVNPDGFDYSREALAQNSLLGAGNGFEGYWRKNRRSFTGVTVPLANKNPDAYGVDPNRNYALYWGEDEQGSSSLPVNQTYRGDEPFSEPETQNVRELILSTNVTGVITNHTYGNLVLRPWGHTSADAPDERILEALGARMARTMGGYRNIKGIGLYATHGTTDDWAYAAVGALGYTFEHGHAFHPQYSIVGDMWPKVIEAFLIMAEASANPRYHSVVTGRVIDPQGRPMKAELLLAKRLRTPLGEGNPTGRGAIRENVFISMITSRDGRFEWHLNPSSRPIPELKSKEAYRLTVVAGSRCGTRRVVVDRGRVLRLGTIPLGPCESVVVDAELGP